MKYLCLIYLNEKEMDAMPAAEMNDLNAAHLALNNDLRRSGHFIEAEALEPGSTAAVVRVRRARHPSLMVRTPSRRSLSPDSI